jgi:hypothetical protein
MSTYQAKFSKLRPKPIPGFIYLVQAVGSDKFKIGKTTNVPNRICYLQTGSPIKIRYVYHAYVQNMNLCERDLHHKFSAQREIGEWFALTREDVEFCIRLMRLVEVSQPPKLLTCKKKFIESITLNSGSEATPLSQSLYEKICKSREEGKTNTWIIENILKMKGRKFGEGKVRLQALLSQFEGEV